MSDLILFNGDGSGVGTVEWVTPRGSKSPEKFVAWDFDVACLISDRDQAGALTGSFPGAAEHFARATEGAGDSANLKIRPGQKAVHVTVTLMDVEHEHNRVLDDVDGEIRSITVRLTEKAQVQVIRLRVPLVDRDIPFAGLMLGRRVSVQLVRDQAELFDQGGVQVGQVITYIVADQTMVGQVASADGDKVVVGNFGRGETIDATEVVQRVRIESEDATPVEEHLARYMDAADGAGALASWADVLEAIALAAGDGEVVSPGATTQYINEAVVDRLIAGIIPPEPV